METLKAAGRARALLGARIMTAPDLADPEKLRDLAIKLADCDMRADYIGEFWPHHAVEPVRAAANRIASQAAEIAELRSRLESAGRLERVAEEDDLLLEIAGLKSHLAAAEAERPKLLACLCAGLPSGNSTYCPVCNCGVAANTDSTP